MRVLLISSTGGDGRLISPPDLDAAAPRWSRDGRVLFYMTADRRLVAVPVRSGSSLELGTPRTLFALEGKYAWATYDVAPDGRFLAIVPEALASEQPLTIVLNWMAGMGAAQSR